MRKFTFSFKSLLVACLLLGGAEMVKTDAQTRTWDFTQSSAWNTVAAESGNVYFATNGTSATSTDFDNSTAICMNATNAFTYSTDHYQFGSYSTSTTSGTPDKDYISVVVPSGYKLTVNASVYYSNKYSNSVNIWVNSSVSVSYDQTGYTDMEWANTSGGSVTAYIYTPSTKSGRYINIKSITLETYTPETLTAITENTSWDFTSSPYTVTFDGITLNNIYLGNGVQLKQSDKIDFGGTGNTSTGANTIQIKIPANKAVGLLIKAGGSNNRKTLISDGTNTLFTINATYGFKDTPITIASSENERTLYIYNDNYATDYGIEYLHVYLNQTVTIGATGYTTFASSYALDLSAMTASEGEVTAFYASASDASSVTMTSTTATVAAGEGLLLKGTAGATITIPVVASGDAISGNKLKGCTTETALTANANYWVLVNNGGTAEFQNLADNGATIPAGKAYLDLTASPGVKALRIAIVDDTATGVEAPVAAETVEDGIYYNLNGQQVTKDYKGIVIVNGKKFLNK